MSSKICLIYTTFPHQEEATEVAKKLLERHLIACANILGPTQALYFWKDKLEESKEVGVLFKTTPGKVEELITVLQDLHSYDTPAILEIPIGKAALPFCEWVHQEVR